MGKRLVLSDIPVHREQDAPFAAFFDKNDPEDLARVLSDAMSTPVPDIGQTQLAQINEQRARQFADEFASLVGAAVARTR